LTNATTITFSTNGGTYYSWEVIEYV